MPWHSIQLSTDEAAESTAEHDTRLSRAVTHTAPPNENDIRQQVRHAAQCASTKIRKPPHVLPSAVTMTTPASYSPIRPTRNMHVVRSPS